MGTLKWSSLLPGHRNFVAVDHKSHGPGAKNTDNKPLFREECLRADVMLSISLSAETLSAQEGIKSITHRFFLLLNLI